MDPTLIGNMEFFANLPKFEKEEGKSKMTKEFAREDPKEKEAWKISTSIARRATTQECKTFAQA